VLALFGSGLGLAAAQAASSSTQTLLTDGVKITFPSGGYEIWLRNLGGNASLQMVDAVTGQPVPSGEWDINLVRPANYVPVPALNQYQTAVDLIVSSNDNSGNFSPLGWNASLSDNGVVPGPWVATGIEPMGVSTGSGTASWPAGYTSGERISATSNVLSNPIPPAPYHVTISPTTLNYSFIPSSGLSVSITDPSGNRPPDGVYGVWFGQPGGTDEWQIAVSNGEVPVWNCWRSDGTGFITYPAGEWATGDNMACQGGAPNYGWGALSPGTYQVGFVTLPSNSSTTGNWPGGATVPATSNSFQVAATAASSGGSGSGTGGTSSPTSGATKLQQTMDTLSQKLTQLSQTNAALYTQALAILNQLISLLGGTVVCSGGSCGGPVSITTPPPSASFSYTWNTDLQYGMYGNPDVSALQQALTLQGVYSGPVSGNFLSATEDAVVLFQQKYGISGTGYVGVLTRAKLNALYGGGPSATTPTPLPISEPTGSASVASPLSVSCYGTASVSGTSAVTNVVWTATVAGGTPPYTYYWFRGTSADGTIPPGTSNYATSNLGNGGGGHSVTANYGPWATSQTAYVQVKDASSNQATSSCTVAMPQ